MHILCIGTYTRREPHVNGTAAGMFLAQFNDIDGSIALSTTVTGLVNPSYVAAAPNGRFLYVLNEGADRINAFAYDPATVAAARLNSQPSYGAGPAHLSVHPTGQFVLVANYGGGSIAVLPVLTDGRLGEATDVEVWHGRGPNPARQEAPHAHMITAGPDGRIYAVDLGTDRIMIYTLDLASGKLQPGAQPWLDLPPGSGPRHLAFHPNGRFAYVLTELSNTVVVLAFEPGGRLQQVQNISTVPADFTGDTFAAAVHVAPSGRFVYASNRGHDSIAIFAVDAASGQLTPAGHCATQGHAPRDFAISPDGRYLLAANQDSSTIVTFSIDPETGNPATAGPVAAVATPVCLTWVRPFGVK